MIVISPRIHELHLLLNSYPGLLLSLGFSAGPIRGKCRRQRQENTALSLVVSTVTIMSEARNLARALNLSRHDGLDMMGGHDGWS